ncbi:MAG: hypothetical protein R3E60_06315 [Alphaproteobacteria bacterium]
MTCFPSGRNLRFAMIGAAGGEELLGLKMPHLALPLDLQHALQRKLLSARLPNQQRVDVA